MIAVLRVVIFLVSAYLLAVYGKFLQHQFGQGHWWIAPPLFVATFVWIWFLQEDWEKEEVIRDFRSSWLGRRLGLHASRGSPDSECELLLRADEYSETDR